MKIPNILKTISKALQAQNATAIIVGGCVRDHFLELPIRDYDVEVYGLEKMEELEAILATYGSVNLVGKSFGVLKFGYEGEEYDFSFPRTESKVGVGHRGFDVQVDGTLSYKEAAKRRDFTINALGYEIEKQQFLDPFGGEDDIQAKVLRHIDDSTFIEDPLRVYRAVQFCARFGYALAEETFVLCQKMVADGMLEELPKERVYAEWQKLLLKSPKPSVGFELMRELGITKRYFPELHALIDVPQSPKWHPEGDVWIHTMMTLDAMAYIVSSEEVGGRSEKKKLKLLFAILCHDLGKPKTTTIETDKNSTHVWHTDTVTYSFLPPTYKIRAIGHEEAGIKPTQSLLYRLTDEHDFIDALLPLVEHHLKPSQFYQGKAKAAAFRRLATKVNIEELVIVAKADFLGRTTAESLAGIYHAGEWMLEKARGLKVESKPLAPLLQGRDLIALGLEPSPRFKEILDEVYAQQLEGKVESREEAMAYIRGVLM